jgi:hypothetical protein
MKPHEMTRAQWFGKGVEYVTTEDGGERISYYPRDGARLRRPQTDAGHRWHIRCAFLNGEPVSGRVLAEYPDLARELLTVIPLEDK